MSHGGRGNGSRSDRRNGTALRHLGLETGSAAWCTIGRIPRPPKDVHAAAGGGALRPAFVRPLGMIGVLLAVVLTPLGLLLVFLSTLEDWADRLLSSKAERARARAKAREAKEQKAAVKAHGLDQLFDGDWTAAAGQFLLRWYGHSSHHKRFLVLTRDRIVLAAPPRRVSVRAEQRMRIVAELPATEAALEDPLIGGRPSDRLRIRFTDGSWLTVATEQPRSEIHMQLMREPRGSR